MGDKQNLAKESQLALKQDKLIAGTNITIALDGKTISAANPTSVTVTPVYQAGTLVAAIIVNGNTTNIYTPAQHGDNANQNLALNFSSLQTYNVGDYVIYQENLYQCITAISTPAAWDSTKWTRALITDVMGQGSGGDYANQNIANTYDTTSTYNVGDYVIYTGLLYKCITAVETPGPFNINYWTRVLIVDEMGSGGGGGGGNYQCDLLFSGLDTPVDFWPSSPKNVTLTNSYTGYDMLYIVAAPYNYLNYVMTVPVLVPAISLLPNTKKHGSFVTISSNAWSTPAFTVVDNTTLKFEGADSNSRMRLYAIYGVKF